MARVLSRARTLRKPREQASLTFQDNGMDENRGALRRVLCRERRARRARE
jgi:hypothetical protein